jgi:hypothetical protein
MPETTLHQDSVAVLAADGTQRFRVTSAITYIDGADLPFTEIFVFQIVDTNDPKQDKFLRVANIHDLTTLQRGRENALLNATTFYLAASFEVIYSDVTTAAAAKPAIATRVDELIAEWITYTTQFVVPTDYELPLVADNIVTVAKNAYYAAKALSDTKDAELATANADLTEANAEAARKATAYSDALARTINCSEQLANMSALQAAYSSPTGYKATMNSLVTAAISAGWNVGNTPGTSGNAGFDSALAAAQTAQANEVVTVTALMNSVASTMATECANENSAMLAAAAAKTSADAAAATAQTTQTVAAAAAAAADAAEAAALAAVLAVCPDFVP